MSLERISIAKLNEGIRNGEAEILEITTSKNFLKKPDFYVEGVSKGKYIEGEPEQGMEHVRTKITPFVYGKHIKNNKI